MNRTLVQDKTNKIVVRKADIDLPNGSFPIQMEVTDPCGGGMVSYALVATFCSNMITADIVHSCTKTESGEFNADIGLHNITLKYDDQVIHSFRAKIVLNVLPLT